MSENYEYRIALLIDAENISAQYAPYILGEVESYGVCSYKRIYGNWDRIVHTKWVDEIIEHSFNPHMLVNNTKGKNASDSALIIDAMDILYRDTVDCFCIVSSDSDFTALARRLGESGCYLIGMGESDKATAALENVYDKFIYIDLLAKQKQEEERASIEEEAKRTLRTSDARRAEEASEGKTPSKKDFERRIQDIIQEQEDKGKQTDLGYVGSELSRYYKNFDVRYYSMKGGKRYKYLKEFVGDFKSLRLQTKDNVVYVSLRQR